MNLPAWHEEAVSRRHDRKRFDCGDAELNRFLWEHARKNHEQGASKTFLAIRNDDDVTIMGFYALSPASVAFAQTPAIVRKGLPHYEIPMFRLGRLAVATDYQGKGLMGGQLLLAAGRRCLRAAEDAGAVLAESLVWTEIPEQSGIRGIRPILIGPGTADMAADVEAGPVIGRVSQRRRLGVRKWREVRGGSSARSECGERQRGNEFCSDHLASPKDIFPNSWVARSPCQFVDEGGRGANMRRRSPPMSAYG